MEKKDLVIGKWYKSTLSEYAGCILKFAGEENNSAGYWRGEWGDYWSFTFDEDNQTAIEASYEDLEACGTAHRKHVKSEDFEQVKESVQERTAKSTATFQSITASLGDLLAYKNSKYGNSALEPLNIFGNKSKVGQRLDDKLSRVQNSPDLRKNDVADIIGYLILVCQENNWTTFDEFKD